MWTLKIVQVIIEVAVSHAKFEVFQKRLIVHQIQSIENIVALLEFKSYFFSF